MIPALVEVAKNIRNAVDDSEFSVYFNKAKNTILFLMVLPQILLSAAA